MVDVNFTDDIFDGLKILPDEFSGVFVKYGT
jgi:hypothetical protein